MSKCDFCGHGLRDFKWRLKPCRGTIAQQCDFCLEKEIWEQIKPVPAKETFTPDSKFREQAEKLCYSWSFTDKNQRDHAIVQLEVALKAAAEEASGRDDAHYNEILRLREAGKQLTQEFLKTCESRDKLYEGFKKLRDTIEFGPFFGELATNCVQEADLILKSESNG